MASTFGRCSLVLIPLTIWLLVKASVDVCPRGDLTVRPFLVIPLGSSVNISCSLKPKQGCSDPNFNQLILYQAEHRINTQRGHLLSSQVKGLPLGTTLFICKLTCNRREERQVCGAEVFVGVTPEEPRSLSCMQSGKHGTVACTWDRGRNTHLITVYTLQLNGPRNLTWQKQCNNPNCDHMDLGINLASEAPEFNYTAKVTATNKLGRASSLPSTFTFSDIVRPLPPWDLSIQYVNGTASKCLLQWRDEEMVQLNRLRYRPHHSRSWNMVNATNAKGRYDLLDLKPFTGYEIQISSKLHLYKGSWSNWSKTLQTQTPEEEPTGMLDVWYMKQDIDHKRQQISLFWKNLSISEARGQILHYEVTLQDETGEEPPQESTTKHTSWSTMVPRTGHWAATVSAVNSKGISLPTRISITDLCGVEWLAPRQVSAHSEGTDTIMVTWEAPDNATSSVQEYVVEWQELWPKGDIPTLDWLRSSPYNRSAGISEFPYQDSPNSHPIDSLQPQVTYILWMTALTAAGESPQGNKREFRLQGKVRWILLVASGICIAILIAGICSVRRFRQKAFVLLTTLRPQWWSREIPDPANSSWAKIHPTVEETTLLQATCLLTGWLTCEEPEPLVINEVLSQATSTHRHPQCPNLPEKRQEIQNHCTPEDRVYDAPSSAPSGGLTTEAGELVELYKMLGCRGPDSKPGDPPSPLTILPVGYLPTQEGYLPSNIADHPAQAAPTTDSPEQGPQHISLSIFPSISLHPLPLSYGEKLTLDQLKMRRDSLVL
ncbi:interleukin-12 receptor subunit beta-2 isoform X2 [Suncus etruscus]|uniref:interleukin-12 receptor subunit beta-2 isoform X2 n=1 Tax=Suncus etruscus TaxID=109475 RepID=UPI00210F296D|nr:interleukin-12 receptor subunit beta-2 isoform X2 [Suncus etruscus]